MNLQLDLLQNDWLADCETIVLAEMRGVEFCADDLHKILPRPEHDNWYGVLLARLRHRLVKVGYQASARPERNGGVVCRWKVKE